jgi:hypothetical protein
MAHYAFLDTNNTVTEVIVGNDGDEWEEFYSTETGQICKRTSYNSYGGKHNNGGIPFRKNYAGIGYKYDEIRDAFIPPQPYSSWLLNEDSCLWEAPIAQPQDAPNVWDEAQQNWVYL